MWLSLEAALLQTSQQKPLPAGFELTDVARAYEYTNMVLWSKNEVRNLDRYARHPQGFIACLHAWDIDPEFYLAEWSGEDPAYLLYRRMTHAMPSVIYFSRTDPVTVAITMYFARPGYRLLSNELDWHLGAIGVQRLTAELPKFIGPAYLERHQKAGYTLIKQDQHRWYVERPITG